MLTEVRRILALTKAQRDTLMKRLGNAYLKACEAFAPFERAVCDSGQGWGMFPPFVLDIETLELSGQRIQNVVNGRCSLAAMLESNPIEMVEEFEREAEAYITKLAGAQEIDAP